MYVPVNTFFLFSEPALQPPWKKAISWFMDGMEAQECSGFKDLHGLLGRLSVPTVKPSQPMTHKDTLEGGFLQSMSEEEQK